MERGAVRYMSYRHLLREHFHTLGKSSYVPEENVADGSATNESAAGATVGDAVDSSHVNASGSTVERATRSATEDSTGRLINCSFGVSPFGYSRRINKRALIEQTDIS